MRGQWPWWPWDDLPGSPWKRICRQWPSRAGTVSCWALWPNLTSVKPETVAARIHCAGCTHCTASLPYFRFMRISRRRAPLRRLPVLICRLCTLVGVGVGGVVWVWVGLFLSMLMIDWFLKIYIQATSKVTLGQVPTCDSVHPWGLCSAASQKNQATRTMTLYLTQSSYDWDMEATSPCHILIMPSSWLGSNKFNCYYIGLI